MLTLILGLMHSTLIIIFWAPRLKYDDNQDNDTQHWLGYNTQNNIYVVLVATFTTVTMNVLMKTIVMLRVVMVSAILFCATNCYAEYRYNECHHSECSYLECHDAKYYYT